MVCAVVAAWLATTGVPGLPALGAPVPVVVDTARVAYQWPLDGPITHRFEPPPEPWLPGHRGVDLAGEPGVLVRAAGPGSVRFAGPVAGRAVVSIQHPDGLRTTYEPVHPLVTPGQRVRAGDVIGRLASGHVGCPTTACLHWGLRRGESYLDPLLLFGTPRVRLLPMATA